LEFLLLPNLESKLREKVEEVSAHKKVRVAGDRRVVHISYYFSDLPHNECLFFLKEFRLVDNLENMIFFINLTRQLFLRLLLVALSLFLFIFFLTLDLHEVSLSELGGAEQ
jgi:hypothetical protein